MIKTLRRNETLRLRVFLSYKKILRTYLCNKKPPRSTETWQKNKNVVEKIQTKERVESLENQLDDAIATVEELREKVELLTANINRLERENKKLEEKNNVAPVVEVKAEEPEEEQLTIDAPVEEAPVEEKKPSRNRVGSMFDLLTFSDI